MWVGQPRRGWCCWGMGVPHKDDDDADVNVELGLKNREREREI